MSIDFDSIDILNGDKLLDYEVSNRLNKLIGIFVVIRIGGAEGNCKVTISGILQKEPASDYTLIAHGATMSFNILCVRMIIRNNITIDRL